MARPLALSLALSALVALPSCYVWSIGRNIEALFVSETGVDVDTPVDGAIYRVGDDRGADYYMLAPEITFHPGHPLVVYSRFDDSPDSQPYLKKYPTGISRTGKQRWVKVVPGKTRLLHDSHGRALQIPMADTTWCYLQDVAALPERAVLYRSGVKIKEKHEADSYCASLPAKSGNIFTSILAAPFTYVVDPVLTVGTTLVCSPFVQIAQGPQGDDWGPQKPLPEDIRRQLQQSTILHPIKGPGVAPYGDYTYEYKCRYSGGSHDYVNRNSDIATWAAELHAFIPKNKPCVLFFDEDESMPSKAVLRAMAAPLQANGFRVSGTLIKRGNSYEWHDLP